MVPRFTPEQARDAALRDYGLAVDARELPSYRDQNFLLHGGAGEEWVLKIANRGEDPAFVAGQVAALEYLATAPSPDPTARLQTPRVVARLDGRTVGEVRARGEPASRHQAWLQTFVPGRPLAESETPAPALLADIGRRLGDLDRRLEPFDHPGLRRVLAWDLARAPHAVGLSPSIRDRERRARVLARLSRFGAEVLPVLRGLPHQVIHNDANDHNVLVREAGTDAGAGLTVSGLVDFGDAVRTARVCEPAVAMTYAMLDAADPIASAVAVLGGFHRSRPLLRREILILADLIEARLCVSVTMSASGRERDPDNEYLTVSESAAWRCLDWLTDERAGRLSAACLDACGGGVVEP